MDALPGRLDDIQSVLTELLRLYDWRNEIGRIERDFNHDKKQVATWLNRYGREKKAAWEAARRVLAGAPSETLRMPSRERLREQIAADPDLPCEAGPAFDDKNYAALILSRSALRRWTDLYAKLQNECGEVVSRKLDYNLPPADHVPALEAIDAALSATTPPTDPLGWVTMTDKRVSDPVYRTREDAEKDADLLRARGIETKVAGVYLAPQSAVARSAPHCQNGTADICLASKADGVTCPDDSCDIDDGVRTAPQSATASISGMPMIKTLKDQRDEVADVLRRLMHKLREDSGSTDPMEPFAYDASWEALAKEADAILAKCPSYTQQMHNLAKGLGMTYDELVAGIDRATKHATDRSADAA